MSLEAQRARADAFRALHRPGEPLVLPNAWDAASARVFALAGARAVGTTSAGVAWSLGCPDGERLETGALVAAAARIVVAAAPAPVTVDVERGFGATPAAACETVRALLAAGAVGVNIEDGSGGGLAPPAVLADKVAALRGLATEMGVPLFVNARTDVYLRGEGDAAARFAETVRRAEAYAEAGADGFFVPGLADLDAIVRLVRAVRLPLNVYAGRGVPAVRALADAGVARVSVGCGPMQATLALARRIARELLEAGTYAAFAEEALPYGEVNAMFAEREGGR